MLKSRLSGKLIALLKKSRSVSSTMSGVGSGTDALGCGWHSIRPWRPYSRVVFTPVTRTAGSTQHAPYLGWARGRVVAGTDNE